ncbi:LCP family protein [Clostridium thermarum]|uniref:LCP family protein n=1 Tax=Clostridium thermarum TaxID=1716543 RepID=UPI0013D097D8|nr:LCP family protein [Clostridium thermarum]
MPNTSNSRRKNTGRQTVDINKRTRRDPRYDRKKRKLRKRKRIIRFLLLSTLLILILGGYLVKSVVFDRLDKLNTEKIAQDDESLGISREVLAQIDAMDVENSITNIALFGIDARTPGEATRSDSIMIATIDYKHKTLKLSSIMRDSRVEIEGHGLDKINHAYAFGGAQLAVNTLNRNFELNIRDYVTINFYGLEEVINSLGGITIDVKPYEVDEINKYIRELCDIDKKEYTPLTSSGTQLLNGRQATSYARIRYVGNGDFERTDRQRRVMDEIFKKVLAGGVSNYPKVVDAMLPYVTTSLDSNDILAMGIKFLRSDIKSITQARFPVDGYWTSPMIKGISYIQPKMPDTKEQIKSFIFENIIPVAK